MSPDPTADDAVPDEGAAGPTPVPVDLRDYTDFDLDEGVGRRVFTTDVLAIDLVCLEPGQALSARTYDTADVVYLVIGGRAWVVIDDAEVTLEPLQSILVPAPAAHAIRNDGADPLILQVTVSPPDEAPPAAEGPISAPDPELGTVAAPTPAARRRQRRGRR